MVIQTTERKQCTITPEGIKYCKLKITKPDSEYDPLQLLEGTFVELEHTPDVELAKTIAKHHLDEHKDYYKALKIMEQYLNI